MVPKDGRRHPGHNLPKITPTYLCQHHTIAALPVRINLCMSIIPHSCFSHWPCITRKCLLYRHQTTSASTCISLRMFYKPFTLTPITILLHNHCRKHSPQHTNTLLCPFFRMHATNVSGCCMHTNTYICMQGASFDTHKWTYNVSVCCHSFHFTTFLFYSSSTSYQLSVNGPFDNQNLRRILQNNYFTPLIHLCLQICQANLTLLIITSHSISSRPLNETTTGQYSTAQ